MRPGQLTPENGGERHSVDIPLKKNHTSFNEAGQLTPENSADGWQAPMWMLGFNEAGAINPGKPEQSRDGPREELQLQ